MAMWERLLKRRKQRKAFAQNTCKLANVPGEKIVLTNIQKEMEGATPRQDPRLDDATVLKEKVEEETVPKKRNRNLQDRRHRKALHQMAKKTDPHVENI